MASPCRFLSGEFRLLTALLERPKIALTRNQLLDLTKGRDADLFDRSIDNHVSRLAQKNRAGPQKSALYKDRLGRRLHLRDGAGSGMTSRHVKCVSGPEPWWCN